MLIILTKPFKLFITNRGLLNKDICLSCLKNIVRKFLGRNRGPQMVTKSLLKGLDELKYPYKYNPHVCEISNNDTVIINENIHILEWAVESKKRGLICKLIAGPNLVVTPDDKNKILMSKEIDLILVPSQWVKNFYLSFNFCDPKKIQVWAAGVGIPNVSTEEKTIDCLIYKKKVDDYLIKKIVSHLRANGVKYKVVVYGRYRQNDYFELLNKSKFMIYLQESESQGVALFEAWARGVPTFVWRRGFWVFDKYYWSDAKISAPYLSEKTGVFFDNFDDFNNKFLFFVQKLGNFNPRDFIIESFAHLHAARNLVSIIGKYMQ